MAQQHLDFGTPAPNDGESLLTAFEKIESNFNELYGGIPRVSVGGLSEALVVNDSSSSARTANKARIQAAIDYAYANAMQVISISAGVFFCDPGIYLDPPDNLRVNLVNPTIFSFSMHLKGAGGSTGQGEHHGTLLRFTDGTTTALIVGTGQGMRVSELGLVGPTPTSRAAHPVNGIGIGLAGGNGGFSRTLLDNVYINSFRRGIVTGFNGHDSLGDSTTIFKCAVLNCYRGTDFSQSQNYINALFDCTFANNTYHVFSTDNKPISVYGGNYSTPAGLRKKFTIGSVSVVTSFSDPIPGGTITNYTFTATVSSPDQPLADGAYDAFAIETAKFGAIPLVLTNYNPGTAVATFKFYPGWVTSHVNNTFNLVTSADISAEVQAVTTLWACETAVMFSGCINVDGVHVENGALTLLYDQAGNNETAALKKLDIQYQHSHFQHKNSAGDDRALFVCQQVFPFIREVNAADFALSIDDVQFGAGNDLNTTGEAILIESVGDRAAFSVRNSRGLLNPNIYLRGRAANIHFQDDVQDESGSMIMGVGEFDETPYRMLSAATRANYRRGQIHHVPFVGFYPAPYAVPQLNRFHFEKLVNGASSPADNKPPCLYGGVAYSVADRRYGNPQANLLVKSGHQYFSHGSNLAVNWSYKGQSHCLYVSSFANLFHGLKIILDNGGGDQAYVINGIYPSLGYVTVIKVGSGRLMGDKLTTYNGSTIKQEPYSFGVIGTLPSVKDVTNSGSGTQTAAVGDLTGAHRVNLLLTAIGAANFTTRTAAEMFDDISGCYVGFKYELTIRNTNAGTTTLNGDTGVTVSGTATIAQNVKRRFSVEFTSASACTLTSLDAVTTL